MMAEISSANTMANPAPDPTLITSSTGSSDTMLNATAPEDSSTPMRFQQPDQTTATGFQRVGVDDRGHGVRRVVKAVDELEAQGQQERKAKKNGGRYVDP